jgi:hypothetical protein
VRGIGQPRISLTPNGYIGFSIPWTWYLEVGTSRRKQEGKLETREVLANSLCVTFSFTVEIPMQREALLRIKDFIFHHQPENTMPKFICAYHKPMEKLKWVVHCWKIDNDDVDEDDPKGSTNQ